MLLDSSYGKNTNKKLITSRPLKSCCIHKPLNKKLALWTNTICNVELSQLCVRGRGAYYNLIRWMREQLSFKKS